MSDVTFEALGRACADAWRAGHADALNGAVKKIEHLIASAKLLDSPKHTVEALEIALKEVKNV
jgi:hypothetical protein